MSLTLPVQNKVYKFDKFPSFFENLLLEGLMLEGINKVREVEKYDLMSQLIISGNNLYGDIEVEPDK
ncbi:MAG TPA: HipA N-terminal domain-containing protein [Ignavibacteria bacterium]